MINTFATYRRYIASILAVWMSMIIISGIVFIHKEVTSTGEIVIHVHPYDFTHNTKHKHESDAEIQYLNVLFHGSFIESEFFVFESPIFTEFSTDVRSFYHEAFITHNARSNYLRGPPVFA